MATSTKKKPAHRSSTKKAAAAKSKPQASRVSRGALVRSTEYSQLTWALMVVWLALVAVFLCLIVYKLYIVK